MPVSAVKQQEIFAGNRATGDVSLRIAKSAGRSRRMRVHEDGSLRVRFPNSDAEICEAVLLNTAGGMTGGDNFNIDVEVGDRAKLVIGTAAAEKIYRSLGAETLVSLKLRIEGAGTLAWLPQETILFDRARLSRRIDVELSPHAMLLMAEAIVFGRSAMDETVTEGSLADRWRVRRGGKLVFAENVRLDGDIASKLASPAIAAGGVAVATVLLAPGSDEQLDAVRALTGLSGEVGMSCWNGIAVARLCAKDGGALRRDLMAVLQALNAPLPRLWTN